MRKAKSLKSLEGRDLLVRPAQRYVALDLDPTTPLRRGHFSLWAPLRMVEEDLFKAFGVAGLLLSVLPLLQMAWRPSRAYRNS